MSEEKKQMSEEKNKKRKKESGKPPYGIYWRYDKDDIKEFASNRENLVEYFEYMLDCFKLTRKEERDKDYIAHVLDPNGSNMTRYDEINNDAKYSYALLQKMMSYCHDSIHDGMPRQSYSRNENGIYLQEDKGDPFEVFLSSRVDFIQKEEENVVKMKKIE